jgi:hypothetical protein
MSYKLIINKDLIPVLDLDKWFLNNKKYIADPVPTNVGMLNNDIPIDLTKFFKLLGPHTWVVDNTDYIDYNKSLETIEFIHTIDKLDVSIDYDDKLQTAVQNNLLKEYTLTDLEDLDYDFSTLKYQEQYMVLEMDATGNLKKSSFSAYNNNKTCYSHPFFYSIVEINSLNFPNKKNWRFYFMTMLINNKSTIAFCVNFNNDTKTMKYYDYSQIPPGVFFAYLPDELRNEIIINGGNSFFIQESLIKTRVF